MDHETRLPLAPVLSLLLLPLGLGCNGGPGEDLTVTPDPLYFGTVELASVIGIAASEVLTLSNNSGRHLTITAVYLSEDDGGVFLTDNSAEVFPLTVAPGEGDVEVTVGVAGGASEGEHEGTLTIEVTSAADANGSGAEMQVNTVDLFATTTR